MTPKSPFSKRKILVLKLTKSQGGSTAPWTSSRNPQIKLIPSLKMMNKYIICHYLYQGRTSGHEFFLLACIHPVMSCRAGWIFNPSMSLGSFGSSKQAAPCIRARMTHAHLFYNVLYILYMKLWKTNVSFT